jgi:hypothetical protein
MRTCPNCELKNQESWTHCRECGFSLTPENTSDRQQVELIVDQRSISSTRRVWYLEIVDARYRSHLLLWVMLLSGLLVLQIGLQLMSGGLLSLVSVASFAVTVAIATPIFSMFSWFVFKLVKRAPGIKA